MGIELVLLMNCVALVWGQSTISGLNDAGLQSNYIEDVKSELDAIRQLIGAQQIAAVCNDRQTIQELKSEIQDIRQSLSNQSHLLETLLHKWHGIAICPRGFIYLPLAGSCYKVVYERHNWTSAGEKCRELGRGSHLVAITSETENSALKMFLASELSKNISNSGCTPSTWTQAGNLFWTSGHRQIENSCRSPYVWKPSRNEMLPVRFSNWLEGEPNCKANQEFCFHIWPLRNFTWNDESCNTQMCPLCEYTP